MTLCKCLNDSNQYISLQHILNTEMTWTIIHLVQINFFELREARKVETVCPWSYFCLVQLSRACLSCRMVHAVLGNVCKYMLLSERLARTCRSKLIFRYVFLVTGSFGVLHFTLFGPASHFSTVQSKTTSILKTFFCLYPTDFTNQPTYWMVSYFL